MVLYLELLFRYKKTFINSSQITVQEIEFVHIQGSIKSLFDPWINPSVKSQPLIS